MTRRSKNAAFDISMSATRSPRCAPSKGMGLHSMGKTPMGYSIHSVFQTLYSVSRNALARSTTTRLSGKLPATP